MNLAITHWREGYGEKSWTQSREDGENLKIIGGVTENLPGGRI